MINNQFAADFEFTDFQSVIDLMCLSGWIKEAREDANEVQVKWTEPGKAKARQMAALVSPYIAWVRSRTGPKPDEETQLKCVANLAPFVREIGMVSTEPIESLKLVVFVALLAPT